MLGQVQNPVEPSNQVSVEEVQSSNSSNQEIEKSFSENNMTPQQLRYYNLYKKLQ